MGKIVKGFGPLIIIYLLIAWGVSVFFTNYITLLVAVIAPLLMLVAGAVPLAVLCWLTYVFEWNDGDGGW